MSTPAHSTHPAQPAKDSKDARSTVADPPQTEVEELEAEIEYNVRTIRGLLDTIHGAGLNAGDQENAALECIRRAKARTEAKENPVPTPLPTPVPEPEPKKPEPDTKSAK